MFLSLHHLFYVQIESEHRNKGMDPLCFTKLDSLMSDDLSQIGSVSTRSCRGTQLGCTHRWLHLIMLGLVGACGLCREWGDAGQLFCRGIPVVIAFSLGVPLLSRVSPLRRDSPHGAKDFSNLSKLVVWGNRWGTTVHRHLLFVP